MPQAHYGLPESVADGRVNYPGGVSRNVYGLQRQDLMRVAGTIAKSKGEKTGGTSWSNDELTSYILRNQPWQSQGTPEDAPKPQDRIPTVVTCSCGHDYTYRIRAGRFDATKKWLESKPCPKCAGKPGEGQENTPDAPEAPQEAPQTPQEAPAIPAIDLEALEERITNKVLERLRPPAPMPDVHHALLPTVVKYLEAGVSPWLQGGPGTSKSTIGIQAAKALGLKAYPQSIFPQMMAHDLFGYKNPHDGSENHTPFTEAFINGGLWIGDEGDNGDMGLFAALNQALANRQAVLFGKVVDAHPDFKALVTANTAGMGPEAGFIGRGGVDVATLDRFASLHVPIDDALELAIAENQNPADGKRVVKAVRKLRKAVEARGIHGVIVSPRASLYSARLVKAGVDLKDALRSTALKGLDAMQQDALLAEAGL